MRVLVACEFSGIVREAFVAGFWSEYQGGAEDAFTEYAARRDQEPD